MGERRGQAQCVRASERGEVAARCERNRMRCVWICAAGGAGDFSFTVLIIVYSLCMFLCMFRISSPSPL